MHYLGQPNWNKCCRCTNKFAIVSVPDPLLVQRGWPRETSNGAGGLVHWAMQHLAHETACDHGEEPFLKMLPRIHFNIPQGSWLSTFSPMMAICLIFSISENNNELVTNSECQLLWSQGRHSHHGIYNQNNIIHRYLASAKIPYHLEPSGLV